LIFLKINRGKGEIDYARISDFEAFSNNGKLNMMITNTGELTAEFNLYFECDQAISPISFQKFFINPMDSKIFTMDITTNNIEDKNHSCEIFLKDAIGDKLDTITINFTTNAINYTSIFNKLLIIFLIFYYFTKKKVHNQVKIAISLPESANL